VTGGLTALITLVESRKLRAVIDRFFPLAEIRDAHRTGEGSHARGKLVIRVTPGVRPPADGAANAGHGNNPRESWLISAMGNGPAPLKNILFSNARLAFVLKVCKLS
jgi:hypothetical protein